MSEWQPIETAPKDYETLILAAFRGGIGMDIVWWRSDTGPLANEKRTFVGGQCFYPLDATPRAPAMTALPQPKVRHCHHCGREG